MAEKRHTPGPWTVVITDDYATYRIQKAATEITSLHKEGNRRLIQAAPDMLMALEAVQRWQYGEQETNDDEVLNIVATAVAKARGKE